MLAPMAPDAPNPLSAYELEDALPDVLPPDPFPIVRAWWDAAHGRGGGSKVQPNPNAMTLATIDPDGRPSARIVLCKTFDEARGMLVFHTHYNGRKGRALTAHPRAALVFHWDDLDRQVRIEGPVVRSPSAESDAYFRTRPVVSRVGAWASRQSEPIESRDRLIEQVGEVVMRLGVPLEALTDPSVEAEVPRPPDWGGFRVWAERVELWIGGVGRVHDRAAWTRTLTPGPGESEFTGSGWSSTRLQP